MITGRNKAPVEISNGGVVIHRRDLDTTHEEADNIIVQMFMVSEEDHMKAGITELSCDVLSPGWLNNECNDGVSNQSKSYSGYWCGLKEEFNNHSRHTANAYTVSHTRLYAYFGVVYFKIPAV